MVYTQNMHRAQFNGIYLGRQPESQRIDAFFNVGALMIPSLVRKRLSFHMATPSSDVLRSTYTHITSIEDFSRLVSLSIV